MKLPVSRTAAILAAVLAISGAAAGHVLSRETVYPGVSVEGVDFGGRSRREAAEILSLWRNAQSRRHIVLYYGDNQYRLDAASLDLDMDVQATVEDAWTVGRRGTWWERLRHIHQASQEGFRVQVRLRYSEAKLEGLLTEWRDQIDRPPRNATLSIQTGGIIPPEPGRRLEVASLRPAVLQALRQGDGVRVPLPVTPVYPQLTAADVAQTGIRELIATYSTSFDARDSNRTANIRLAARRISGHIVYPGQLFSFNETVGPRDKNHGFKEALEIVDGEFVPGIGGGVCQVSSTLYNGVLLANLAVVERYNHSRPLGYVPLGQDATVVYGVLDFRFTNNTAGPVMLIAETEGSKLHIGVFGRQRSEETVEIAASGRQVIPPAVFKQQDGSLFLGETKIDRPGKPGYEVTTVRIVRRQGREIRRETLATDRYLPENTVVKVGTRLPPFAANKPAAGELE